MSLSPSMQKLALTLRRVKGQKKQDEWITSVDQHTIGKEHELFAPYSQQNLFIADTHLELYFEQDRWYAKSLTREFNTAIGDQPLKYLEPIVLPHNCKLDMGLCQIHVSNIYQAENTAELRHLLIANTPNDHSELEEDVLLQDPQAGLEVNIGSKIADEKTTFEDLGLGINFDEEHFFKEIQSESAHIKTLQSTTADREDLDILDQLAIESEIAIINPSLLNKNVDYWQGEDLLNQIPSRPIPELEHLFALTDHQSEHMVPLDNMEQIKSLLSKNGEEIDEMINDLDAVDEYALFGDEQRVEPLRLFSLENHDIKTYIPYATPEFTQKEHHTITIDSFFKTAPTPSVKKSEPIGKTKPVRTVTPIDDDWLSNFGAPITDNVSSDDLLDIFSKKPQEPQ